MNAGDHWHDRAVALVPFVERHGPVATHALVVAEVVALLGARGGGKAARTGCAMIHDAARVRVPTAVDLDAAMDIVVRYDGGLSLCDALSLHYVADEDVRDILSFDADFDGKGVRRVCEPPGPRRPRRPRGS